MDINVTTFLLAQLKKWWPTVKEFEGIYEFIMENLGLFKLGIFFISGVLLVGVIIVYKKWENEFELFRNLTFKDLLGLNVKKPIKYLKQWEIVENNLKSRNEYKMKIAVIDAKRLFDRLLEESGYKGENFETKLRKFINISEYNRGEDLLEVEDFIKNLEKHPEKTIDYHRASGVIKIYKEGISKELVVNIDEK